MSRVGLTGGIASGKSTVASLLQAHGAVVIDSDQLAREVVAPGSEGLQAIVEQFGGDVLATDGSLDRSALGRRVFADTGERAALNDIVHPLVRRRAAELEAQAPPGAVVVQMIPLLVETGQQATFDEVVVVDIPPQMQLERIVRRDGLTLDEARARLAAQASREERLAAATRVIDNSGSKESLQAAVADLWSQLAAR